MGRVSSSPRKRSTAVDKVNRDARIVADHLRGLSWTTLSEKYGVSVRQCQNIWAERAPFETTSVPDTVTQLADELEALDVLIEDLTILAETTANDAIRLGAIKTRMDAQSRRLELKRQYGLLPWDRHEIRAHAEMHTIVATILDVFKRHDVSDDLIADLVDTLRQAKEAAAYVSAPAAAVAARASSRGTDGT